jgi:predicted unusual protein kinase regulating ubiquinone biosynthesis (AarF/ABC1/UbiB family)
MLRAWYRMLYAGRLLYVDLHPGNFLFMDDGRLGVIDFGCMVELDDGLWDLFRKTDRPITTGRREDRVAVLKEWSVIGDDPADAERLRLHDEYAEWSWRARASGRPFDFGDEADFRGGIDLFVEMFRRRYNRGHFIGATIARYTFALRAILYRLRANVNVASIAEEEVRATGWDRSDFGPR